MCNCFEFVQVVQEEMSLKNLSFSSGTWPFCLAGRTV